MEEIMKQVLLVTALFFTAMLASSQAEVKREYQPATVVSVETHETPSNYVGDNPMDAPMQANVHSYDIGIRLNCAVYKVRYESMLDYLPSVFAPNHAIDVDLQKRVMDIALPGDRDVRLGIVYRSRAKDTTCVASK
jgi:hypothetical protein